MVGVLRRLRQLRHVYVVGALGVARVDVCARDAVGLLDGGFVELALGSGMRREEGETRGRDTYGQLRHDGLELRRVQEAAVSKELELGADGAEGAVGGGGFDAHCCC